MRNSVHSILRKRGLFRNNVNVCCENFISGYRATFYISRHVTTLLSYVIGMYICMSKMFIALSHIHVSAAYRSRIYENVDTPRSEPYFVQATYVPRTCDIPATYP